MQTAREIASDIDRTCGAAESLLAQEQLPSAARLYHKAYEKCSDAKDVLRKEGTGRGGYALATASLLLATPAAPIVLAAGGLGGYLAAKARKGQLTSSFRRIDERQRQVAIRLIELGLCAPYALEGNWNRLLLQYFFFLYTGIDRCSALGEDLASTPALESAIRREIPRVEHENYHLNQFLLDAAAHCGWTVLERELASRGYNVSQSFPGRSHTDQLTLNDALQILTLPDTPTLEQANSAYRREVRLWHPDRLGDAPSEMIEYARLHTSRLNEAISIVRANIGGSAT